MVELYFFNVGLISNIKFEQLLNTVPKNIQQEVFSYRTFNDRKLNLLGKIIIAKYHQSKNIEFKWCFLKKDKNGKPFLSNNIFINVSHSEDYVVVSFSKNNIGIDIEKIVELDYKSISTHLHPKEDNFIESSCNKLKAFYYIWTRKEAFLKAKGKGILGKLGEDNCLDGELKDEGQWFIQSLPIIKDYKLAVCSQDKKVFIIHKPVQINDLLK